MPWSTDPDFGELVKGKRVTCYPRIRDDVKAAGAEYLDMEVMVDDRLVTSRVLDDLLYMMRVHKAS